MTNSLFIKSHSRDFPWLEWCKKSIERYCRGFSEVVLCLPEGASFTWPGAKIVYVRESFTPYLYQQAIKLFADEFCSGDFITYQDSDTIFTRETTPESLRVGGKPIWITRPWDEARPDQQVWRKPTSKFIGQDAPFEGMYRHPFTVHRDLLKRMRGFCQFQHGVSLDQYIANQAVPGSPTALTFSEWNAVGAFAWIHARDSFHWVDSSKEQPEEARCFQGFTWAGEVRKQEDLSKFKELLEGNPEEGDIASGVVPSDEKPVSVAGKHDLTVPSAIAFLCENATDNAYKARVIRQLKSGWKGVGKVTLKKKVITRTSGTLLCIHSYPGANETLLRHWPHFCEFGADRVVGIGTKGGGTKFPCESVEIGENRYMKMKGKDDNLCQRLLNTVKWCLSQPEERFAILEYDTLVLRKMPHWQGVNAHLTGGSVNGSIATQFFHNPWMWDRESGESLVRAMEAAIGDSAEYPNNSPDLFFGLACERAGIKVGCNFKLFTRNTLDHDLHLACEAARLGCHVIHGVKTKDQYDAIMESMRLATA